MAKNVILTSDENLTVTHYHNNKPARVSPNYEATFILTPTLQLSVTFKDTSDGWFNFDVGFIAKGNNGTEIIKSDKLAFGKFPDGTNYGYGNKVTLAADLSKLTFPITFSFICQGCDYEAHETYNLIEWLDGSSTWIIKDGRHTHITKPNPPQIKWTSGTKIHVGSGEDGICCTTTNSGWNNSPHTFDNLTQGTNYSFKCKKECPNCPDGKIYESNIVTGKTWSIFGTCTGSGSTSMTFKAKHIAGTKGNGANNNGTASDHKIVYDLLESKYSTTPVATKTAANNTAVKFTGLDPNKTYYCYAYTEDIKDNNCWITGSTKKQASIQSSGGDVSATTLRAAISWSSPGAISTICFISCNGQYRNVSSSGSYVGFTGLASGSTYTVSWGITSTYVINEETGETEQDTISGSFTLTTKQASFVQVNRTSKIIQFSSKSNYSQDTMEQKIDHEDWYGVNQNELSIHNDLTHNTSYNIYCRIAGCYAFNSSGEPTNINDSEISQIISTYLLSLSGSIYSEHQHSIITLWQAKVNGENTDIDNIDGTEFEFVYINTSARKNNPPYQSAEVIEGVNGNTIGDYQIDKKVYSNNLTWYYCEYAITVQITDGYNVVSATVIAHTIFPATWIYSGGQWHRYMGYVYTNNKWVPAPAFVYKNNKFIEPNGE